MNPSSQQSWQSQYELAEQLAGQGKLDEAAEKAGVAIASAEKAFGKDHGSVGDRLRLLGEIERMRGNPEKAESAHRRGLDLRRKAYGSGSMEEGISLNNLAVAVGELGRPEEALELAKRAVETLLTSLGLFQ